MNGPDPGDPLRAAFAEPPSDPSPARLVRSIQQVVGADQVRAIFLFGSHMVQASPDRNSAYDLVVVVERYRAFYDAITRAGLSRRSPLIQSALNRVLAPNVIALAPEGWDDGPVAKVMVVEPAAFERALSVRSPDHFLKGRLVQKVALLHARDPRCAHWAAELFQGAREGILAWVGPFLDEPFTPAGAALCMLRTSYAGEVRPEAHDRVLDVFAAQRGFLEGMMGRVLSGAAERGVLREREGAYRFTRGQTAGDRRRLRRYFLRSKVRATARWLKHVMTFDNWLDYIARKVERRTGMRIEITPWERRLPFVLLWPKALRVLRARPTRLGEASSSALGNDRP